MALQKQQDSKDVYNPPTVGLAPLIDISLYGMMVGLKPDLEISSFTSYHIILPFVIQFYHVISKHLYQETMKWLVIVLEMLEENLHFLCTI